MDIGLCIACVVAYAVAGRVEFHTGAGWTVPTELIFVPMLFLLPLNAVPLLVATALVVSRLPDVLRGNVHPARLAVFFPSLVFGFLRVRTRGIGASMLFHALCNLFSAYLLHSYFSR